MFSGRIVVIGSGVVGLACALGLVRSGYQVTVLGDVPEKFDAASDYGLRVYALNTAALELLSRIRVWEDIKKLRTFPYEAMYVYDGEASVNFHSTDIGKTELGFIVEDVLLRHLLFEALKKQSAAHLLCPERLDDLKMSRNKCVVVLEGGAAIEADVVIGADGAQSQVRRCMGVAWREVDYSQKAIIATVKVNAAHQNACWQWFQRDSILAFLPLTKDRVSIVWSCDHSLADTLIELSPQDFSTQLSESSVRCLGNVSLDSERKVFPLRGGVADAYVSDRVVLVGDAAHCVHPLAGQGLNLGLADVSFLLQMLAGGDISRAALRRYERGVKSQNLFMKWSLENLKRFFSTQNIPVTMLREAGLKLTNQCIPLKSRFIHHAQGIKSR